MSPEIVPILALVVIVAIATVLPVTMGALVVFVRPLIARAGLVLPGIGR